jgi:hypothetical protein
MRESTREDDGDWVNGDFDLGHTTSVKVEGHFDLLFLVLILKNGLN